MGTGCKGCEDLESEARSVCLCDALGAQAVRREAAWKPLHLRPGDPGVRDRYAAKRRLDAWPHTGKWVCGVVAGALGLGEGADPSRLDDYAGMLTADLTEAFKMKKFSTRASTPDGNAESGRHAARALPVHSGAVVSRRAG